MLTALIKTMRPRQWVTKNIFIFAALVADKQLFKPEAFLRTLAGFALFSLISSCVYIINDLADVEADRQHPEKKNRPIASGKLPVGVAVTAAVLFVAITFVLAYLLTPSLLAVIGGYFVINLAYSKWLKHVPILDVLIISTGFVLRVGAGVTLIEVERFSPWLYVVMTLLSLFLGFGKRRAELALLANGAGSHRKVLDGYTLPLLDQYIMIVSGATIVAYSLYTFSAPNLPENHTMMLTIPFVVYAIFRYMYLIEVKHAGGAPEEVLLSDRPFQLAMVLWGLTVLAIFYLS
ncbi:MAG TPA: decaprenyl-phosphate phosphoribosyltransferase [Anaerolineales bacterium]|nr:decaprenyl-phosphate phosphoribosyltransferase [Anaerolineales bacterium]HMX19636.1 decaprenyl-phosphate phosphoribosyltransferase [Anaerolineales bacterium]HMX76278.1 decaprenyl-phosphate phosphoribosyltransferase [Anaerolineales bacterium]HMZ45006.1 decaprenyl-phosphate phosphoribosyltransferase [Anaerolineales bacterium]HNA54937.1 decaprenyl-phosphate phosphoribosyltransferase [Anaerolineales bacterium]